MTVARRAFTLVELLVVIGIIALLISILLPSLNRARQVATSVKCLANLQQIGQALVLYNGTNRGYNVPSYNMKSGTTSTSALNPMDGWAPILVRDNFIKVGEKQDNSVFVCPDARTDVNAPRLPTGSVLWPCVNPNSIPSDERTIPLEGFTKIIRVGYWINADNPTGRTTAATGLPAGGPMWWYTGSVGFGPMQNGQTMGLQKITNCRNPTNMIVLADGIYAGRQGDVKITDFNSNLASNNERIGYRHKKGGRPGVNVAFADGHAGTLTNEEFPYGYDIQHKTDRPKSWFRQRYSPSDYTLHADPAFVFNQADD